MRLPEWTCKCTHIPYSRKLLREKTFTNFTVLWLFAKVLSVKFVGVAYFGAAKVSNPWQTNTDVKWEHFISLPPSGTHWLISFYLNVVFRSRDCILCQSLTKMGRKYHTYMIQGSTLTVVVCTNQILYCFEYFFDWQTDRQNWFNIWRYTFNVSLRLWAPSSVAILEDWHLLKKQLILRNGIK